MNNLYDSFFTIGQFATKSSVTLRTLRYYDKIGLLKPSAHNDAGHRLYSKNDFAKLQKILTLKFIGLSLEEISKIMKYEISEHDFKNSLEIQVEIMQEKVIHMNKVIDAINETLLLAHNDYELSLDKFINIINIINVDNNWLEQYENASNLKVRIKIHELFSTNTYGWMRWFFEHMSIASNAKILELGCGDASLWVKNLDRISNNWDITLTDFSQGMIKDAKETLKSSLNMFKFNLVDAQSIPYNDNSFDVIIANNMLYHVPDIELALSEIKRVLKPNGYFYASTVGKNHMTQLRDIASRFNSEKLTTKSWNLTEKFQLENGLKCISKFFINTRLKRYNDGLLVTDAAPLIDYIFSMPGNKKENFDNEMLLEFKNFMESEIRKANGIHITKDTGFFEARKNK